MIDLRSHLQQLSDLVREAAVTNRQGIQITLEAGIQQAVETILAVSRKIMLIGNWGSAAIASHMQNDLCKAVGVRAMVFNEPPLLTALSNDHGYLSAFQKPIELWVEPGDLLIAISSSGQSENILRAAQACREGGGQIITFSGFRPDNLLRRRGEINFYVSSENYGQVEVAHMTLTHFLTDCAMAVRRPLRAASEPANE